MEMFRVGDLVKYKGITMPNQSSLAVVYEINKEDGIIGVMFSDSEGLEWFYLGITGNYFENLTYKGER